MKDIFDIDGPAQKVQRKILERHVQSASVKWWMSLTKPGSLYTTWARKFSSPSQRSVTDYLFSVRVAPYKAEPERKNKFAVEFKAPGKTSTEAQLDEQQKMRDAGWDVYECNSVEKFKEIAQRHL